MNRLLWGALKLRGKCAYEFLLYTQSYCEEQMQEGASRQTYPRAKYPSIWRYYLVCITPLPEAYCTPVNTLR